MILDLTSSSSLSIGPVYASRIDCRKENETDELILPWLSSLAILLMGLCMHNGSNSDGNGIAQHAYMAAILQL